MTRIDVEVAVAEAERFIARAKALLDSTPETYQPESRDYKAESWDGGGMPKLSGATRRASMDLTRALAHLRRRGT